MTAEGFDHFRRGQPIDVLPGLVDGTGFDYYRRGESLRGQVPVTVTGGTVTAVVLTVTPSLPAARLDHSLTAVVLTVTPSLPAAATSVPVDAIVLTVTPSYPQARLDHSITAAVLTVTPSYPTARLDTDLTAVVLSVTPSLPAASVRHHTSVFATSDVATNGWSDNLGGTTNIYTTIDETTADDADYVRSPSGPAGQVYEFHLGDPTDPVCSGGHIVSYRYYRELTSGPSVDLVVRLMQGAVEIASWTHNTISDTVTESTQTLTPTQADAISDYSDLRIRLEATQV